MRLKIIFFIAIFMVYGCGSSSSETESDDSLALGINESIPDNNVTTPVGGSNEESETSSSSITFITIEHLSQEPALNVPVTFGHVFTQGDVPNDKTLVIDNSESIRQNFQVITKATYPDGSAKHVIFSGLVNTNGSKESTFQISLADLQTQPKVNVALPEINEIDTSVEITLDNIAYTSDLTNNLNKYEEWFNGPIASEWVITAPLVSENGVIHPQLFVKYELRKYKDLTNTRIAVTVENTWAYPSADNKYQSSTNIIYDAKVTIDDKVKLQVNGLEHFHHSRWRRIFWSENDPLIDINFNNKYLIATKALPNYDLSLEIPDSELSNMQADLIGEKSDLMNIGTVDKYMPATGASPGIGPLPRWSARYMISMDSRAKKTMLVNSEQAGTWSMHYRNPITELPITIDDYPYMTIKGRYGDTRNRETDVYEAFPACDNCATNFIHDTAHQPSLSYLPYLVTGDYYHLEELTFWANYNLLESNPGYRQHEKGLIIPNQTRGQAWVLRTLAHAVFILPNSHPLQAYFKNKLENNRVFYQQAYVDKSLDYLYANDLGWIGNTSKDEGNAHRLSFWMDDFMTWSVGHVVELGFDKWDVFLNWKAKLPINRMISEDYCYVHAAAYQTRVSLVNSDVYHSTIKDLYQGYLDQFGLDDEECGSQAMADNINNVLGYSLKAGEMTGYSHSATGYPSNLQPALAIAFDSGLSQGADAWQVFEQRTTKPLNYSENPQFAILPRSLTDTTDEQSEENPDPNAPNLSDIPTPIAPVPREIGEKISSLPAGHPLLSLKAGHWYEIPNSKMETVFPTPSPAGSMNARAVMVAWSGGAYDTNRERLLVWGGGHADYSGNEIYAFDVETLQWQRVTEPELDVCVKPDPTAGSTNTCFYESTGYYEDGSPRARHTYDTLEYIPSLDSFCAFGSSTSYPSSSGHNYTDCYDFAREQWYQLPNVSGSGFTAYDHSDGLIYSHAFGAGNSLEVFDVQTEQWSVINNSSSGQHPWSKRAWVATIDESTSQMISMGNGKFNSWQLDSGILTERVTTGDNSIVNATAPGVEYDQVLQQVIAWNGGKDVYILDSATWDWKQQQAQPTNVVTPTNAEERGTYGRFRYMPAFNAYIVVNRTNENVYLYKLTE